MKMLTQKFLTVLTGCLFTCYAHARLGDGPLVGEMFHFSDVVCAGRVTGYDFATLGQTSVWVVVEFTLDHAIKRNAATNIIGIMGYQLDGAVSTNEISRLLRQMKKTPRCLVFLREVNVKAHQYKLTDDLNGMLPACDKKPIFQESADEKARLSVELNRAHNELAVGERELLEIVAGDWLNTRKTPSPRHKGGTGVSPVSEESAIVVPFSDECRKMPEGRCNAPQAGRRRRGQPGTCGLAPRSSFFSPPRRPICHSPNSCMCRSTSTQTRKSIHE